MTTKKQTWNCLHQKCLGQGFAEDEKQFMRGEQCDRIKERHCTVYLNPVAKWEHTPGGRCAMASHYRPDLAVAKKGKINPIKASKRSKRG